MSLSLPEPSPEEHKGEKYVPQQMTPDRGSVRYQSLLLLN